MVRIPNKPSLTDQIWSILNHYWRQIAILLVVIAILSLFFPQG